MCRNSQTSRCEPGTDFGLSGYGFGTATEPFALSVEAGGERYKFNTIKVVSASASSYRLAALVGNKKPTAYSEKRGVVVHKVKNGETLDTIARTYKTYAADIKKENKLKTADVQAGRSLRVPVKHVTSSVDTSMFRPLNSALEPFVLSYRQDAPMSAVYALSAGKRDFYCIDGLVVENGAPGVVYHNIGTVGAMAEHFNATPLFFEQLPALRPDLVVVSFGTNESYGELSADAFMGALEAFIDNIQTHCRGVPVLVTSPPFSLLRHKRWNTYIADYAEALPRKAGVALWDLYAFTAGRIGVNNDFAALKISRDNIHYTAEGYIEQGAAFAGALLDGYDAYKRGGK